MKLCKNCEFCEAEDSITSYWNCGSKENTLKTSPLTGKATYPITFCEMLREKKELCGPDGVWFKEKKWETFAEKEEKRKETKGEK